MLQDRQQQQDDQQQAFLNINALNTFEYILCHAPHIFDEEDRVRWSRLETILLNSAKRTYPNDKFERDKLMDTIQYWSLESQD